jgi:RNA polymerase sigma factor (sigma-70 family)
MTLRTQWEGYNDASVVERAAAGCTEAMAELYRRYTRMVFKIVYEGVSDPHARLDIHQCVFERVMSKLDTLRDGCAFQAWLTQITRRAIVDYYRSIARVDQVSLDTVAARDIASADASPSEWAEMRGLARQVSSAMLEMSSRDAEALQLRASGGMDCAEIAECLGIKGNHARVVLHRARNRLRAGLLAVEHGEMLPA